MQPATNEQKLTMVVELTHYQLIGAYECLERTNFDEDEQLITFLKRAIESTQLTLDRIDEIIGRSKEPNVCF